MITTRFPRATAVQSFGCVRHRHSGVIIAQVSSVDRVRMQQALSLAKRGLGRTFPNPAVGCVIYSGDKVQQAADPTRSAA